jgi:1-acyl-sn-glycerol-3-phosphate acyltransferase
LLYAAYLWTAAGALGCAALGASLLPTAWRWPALRALARALVAVSGVPVAIHGIENIPATGPVIVAANHASYIDSPLLFALLPRRARFVAKGELARNPVARFVFRAAGAVFVERFDIERGVQAARELARLAGEGEALVFFAEGTFTRAPGLMPFHMGAFVAAAESGAPVIPLTIRGTRSVLRDGQWLPRWGPIHVSIGVPQAPSGSDWRSAVRLRDAIRAEILAGCGESDLAALPTPTGP